MQRFWLIFMFAITPGLLACSGASIKSTSERYRGQTLLLTYFEPFGGRPDNQSKNVVEALAKNLEANLAGMEIATCSLPVEYDRAAGAALECASKYQAKYVIGFGEGDCRIRLETAANNKDDTPKFPDNAGVEYADRKIDPAAEERIGFSLPVHKMYCGISPEEKKFIVTSITPGNFVCNNLAFHMAERLINSSFAFIHVPHGDCKPEEKNSNQNAEKLARLIKQMFLSDGISLWRPQAMPSSMQEVIGMRAAVPRDSCEASFLDNLEKNYLENLEYEKKLAAKRALQASAKKSATPEKSDTKKD